MKRLAAFIASFALAGCVFASKHPANVPTARIRLEDGNLTVKVRFDILAFCLDRTPRDAEDEAMNALLDGSKTQLQNRLNEAKSRFKAALQLTTDDGAATLTKLTFPSAEDVIKRASERGRNRLPVMLTVAIVAKLPKNATRFASCFPDVLVAVIVTTELPYQEPVTVMLAAGAQSRFLRLPTAAEIAVGKRETEKQRS